MASALQRLSQWRRFPAPGRSVPLARRSLLDDRVRFAISLGGMAFAVLLVLLLRGIMDGTVAKSTSYIDHVGADVFVASHGVTDMSLAVSSLPESAVASLAGAPGVADAGGIVRFNAIVARGSDSRPAIMIGYDPLHPLGGPWKLTRGRSVESPGEMVVDSVLAAELGVRPGDTVALAGKSFTVVGLSGQTAAIAGKVVFVERTDAQAILHSTDQISFVLLKLEAGIDPRAFTTALASNQPTLEVLTRDELSHNDRTLLGRLFVEPINVMSTVGLIVGLAIVGLTMYTTIAARLRDFGVLKAIGAPNGFLLRTVVTQAVALGLMGFVLGLCGVLASAPIVVRAVPDIAVHVQPTVAAQALGATLAMSFIGAVVPVVRILGVDPLMVFRR